MKKQSVITNNNHKKLFLFLGVVLVLGSFDANAYTTPTSGAGFDLWDIVVNKFLKGPIGATVGVIGMSLGIIAVMAQNLKYGATAIVGGAALLKADTIATSFGLTVDLLV